MLHPVTFEVLKMGHKSLALCITAVFLMAGCTKKEDPVVLPGTPVCGGIGNGTGASTGPVARRLLLEVFTGYKNNNASSAQSMAEQLELLYQDSLVMVSIHTGSFAAPDEPPMSNGAFTSDFRTADGDEIASSFGALFIPAGMVSRKPFMGNTVLSVGDWGTAASGIIGEEAEFDLWFSRLVYDADSHSLCAQADAMTMDTVPNAHHLVILLVEDPVIDWQLINSVPVSDYSHRNVLRAVLNSAWGQPLVPAGSRPDVRYSSIVAQYAMDPAWNATDCSLIAYLYDPQTMEVKQVVERAIVP